MSIEESQSFDRESEFAQLEICGTTITWVKSGDAARYERNGYAMIRMDDEDATSGGGKWYVTRTNETACLAEVDPQSIRFDPATGKTSFVYYPSQGIGVYCELGNQILGR
jgi:hypothetical protein